jgi:type II secretory pathway component GspD/PulD (secretin)
MKWQVQQVAVFAAVIVLMMAADHALAQTIQLPRLGTNAVTTTVTAPDRGTVLLGGIKSARESRNELGVPILGKLPFVGRGFRNVGIGREVSSSMMTVTPVIHDFAAMERELLGTSPRRSSASIRSRGGAGIASQRARDAARQQFAQVERPRRDTIAGKAAELRNQQGGEQAEAELYYSKARTAFRQGKISTARIFLRMAASRATGDLRDRVLYAQNAMDLPNQAALAGR